MEAPINPFDALAGDYEAWFETPLGAFVLEQEMQALARILPGRSLGAVVDIGAGTGVVGRFLGLLGYEVTAVEPSRPMREEGIARAGGLPIRWIDATAEDLPLATGGFDGAIMFTSLEFVADPKKALQEAERVVHADGWVVVGLLNPKSAWGALYQDAAARGEEPWVSARLFTREEAEALMGRAATAVEEALHLDPNAQEPFEEAERSAKQAGAEPAMRILRWEKAT